MVRWFGAVVLFLATAVAYGDDSYQVEFFSYSGRPGRANETHTFARFTRITAAGKAENTDISWLPEEEHLLPPDNNVPWFGEAVPGKNYTLEQTRALTKRTIVSHGKFSIQEELYQRARARKEALEKKGPDAIRYRMLADGIEDPSETNCIHAVSAIVGPLDTGGKMGRAATQAVVEFFIESEKLTPLTENR